LSGVFVLLSSLKVIFMKTFINVLFTAAIFISFLQACSKSYGGGPPTTSSNVNVTTIAGSGTAGFTNGDSLNAEFDAPTGIVLDAQGNIYVTDRNNNCVRLINTLGVVSTLAGNGEPGYLNGTGAAAEFHSPDVGICVDSNLNVFLSDQVNCAIREINSMDVVTTLAGNGIPGLVNGIGPNAEFNYPRGITIDGEGNLYVGDEYNNCIRKVTSTGSVTVLAGNGTAGYVDGAASTAEFNNIAGVALDGQGNLYVADDGNNRIRIVTTSGNVYTVAGNGISGFADGTALNAEFGDARGLAVDTQGNIYVGDYSNNAIRKITTSGMVSTIAGNGTAGHIDGKGTSAEFNYPIGVTIDSNGNLYVADSGNNRIRKITLD
jgi:sugar lactone lactonase YvrE